MSKMGSRGTESEIDILREVQKKRESLELLPNRWIIAVGAGLFLGLKSTGLGFELTPEKFYQLFMEVTKYIFLALVVVSVWMSMFRFFVGKFKGELAWFAILMVFLFSTETFANLFTVLGKQLVLIGENKTIQLREESLKEQTSAVGVKENKDEVVVNTNR